MKWLILLFSLVVIPVIVVADDFIRNDSGATAVNGSNKYAGKGGVNQYGDVATKPYAAERADYWAACTGSDITDTTSTAIYASGATGVRHYITSISISNMHATQATRVDILDGSTLIDMCSAAAGGGGCTKAFPIPLRGTAATALNCKPATTGATIRCCAQGFDASR